MTVPAGNTEANDQYLENVTLTDIRKLESGYPNVLASEPFVYVPLRYALPSVYYGVILEVQSYVGSAWQLGDVYAADKTVNGFKIKTNGACDRLVVRWTLLAKRGAAVNGA